MVEREKRIIGVSEGYEEQLMLSKRCGNYEKDVSSLMEDKIYG